MAVAFSMIVVTGCNKKEEVPTLGTVVEDYEGFKQLEAVELNKYYGMTVYWDADKAADMTKEITANPPTTQKVTVGSYTTTIPKSWEKDTKNSKYPNNVYAENGSLSATAPHIMLTSSTTKVKGSAVTKSVCEALSKQMISGGTVKVQEVTSPVDGTKAFQHVVKKGSNYICGYYIFGDYNVAMLNVASVGKPGVKLTTPLDDAFNNMAKAN